MILILLVVLILSLCNNGSFTYYHSQNRYITLNTHSCLTCKVFWLVLDLLSSVITDSPVTLLTSGAVLLAWEVWSNIELLVISHCTGGGGGGRRRGFAYMYIEEEEHNKIKDDYRHA